MPGMFVDDPPIHKRLGIPVEFGQLLEKISPVGVGPLEQTVDSPLDNQDSCLFSLDRDELVQVNNLCLVALLLKAFLSLLDVLERVAFLRRFPNDLHALVILGLVPKSYRERTHISFLLISPISELFFYGIFWSFPMPLKIPFKSVQDEGRPYTCGCYKYKQVMSLDQIRRLRLLKDLERSPRLSPKQDPRRSTVTSASMTDNLRKINKNKKYMLEEERNTEIERNNRILYQKIAGHFQHLKETMQSRNKWRKRKKKVKPTQEENSTFSSSKVGKANELRFKSRVETIRESKVEEFQTLFLGKAEIDGVALKVKLSLSRERYLLLASNSSLSIELEMDYSQYIGLHRGLLEGNPCGIFNYLEIKGNEVRFKEGGARQRPKTKTII